MTHEATELLLYINNESSLYPKKVAIAKNMARKMEKDSYSSALAVKGWMYLVEDGAKKYVKEFSSGSKGEWARMFPPSVRKEVAKELESEWYASAAEGDMWWL